MRFRLITTDGLDAIVERPFWYGWTETKGFHHFKFVEIINLGTNIPNELLIRDKRVAIPLADIKYLIWWS
jgi:hypothetical protein